jgi:Tol biopolymer transport system component
MHGSANALLAADHLLYMRENALLAAPFDLKTASLTGEPTVVATDVMYDVTVWRAGFSVSDQGELAFHSGTAGGEIQIAKRDRSGGDLGNIGDPGNFGSLRLSPDGKRVATDVQGGETDIWVYEVARGVRSRLTFGSGANLSPVWSPDGQFLAYASIYLARRDTTHRISRRPSMGGDEEVLYTSNEETWVSDWSRDGKYLLLSQGKYIGGNPCDIWVLPLTGERRPFPLVKAPFLEDGARFSPDGKWVAYQSNESGRWEIYVIPFNPPKEDGSPTEEPVRGGKWQVSAHGGAQVEWRADGKELYFVSADGKVTAVEIGITANGIEIGATSALFTVNQPAGIDTFDVSPDGEWFAVNTANTQGSSPINLIVNWTAELKR